MSADKVRAARILAVIAIVLLVAAVFGPWPYGFYTFLRLFVCGTSAYLAFVAFTAKSKLWPWLMGGLAVLFNPLVPIHLQRDSWQFWDALAATVLVVFVVVSNARMKERGNIYRTLLGLVLLTTVLAIREDGWRQGTGYLIFWLVVLEVGYRLWRAFRTDYASFRKKKALPAPQVDHYANLEAKLAELQARVTEKPTQLAARNGNATLHEPAETLPQHPTKRLRKARPTLLRSLRMG